MALTPKQITQQIRLTTPDLFGKNWIVLTNAMGRAIHTWLIDPSSVKLQGVGIGVLGVGAVPTGKVTVRPVRGLVRGAFTVMGLNGADSGKIVRGVSKGVSNAINATGEYYGNSTSVGIGVDSCKVILANQKALQIGLVGAFATIGIVGADSKKLSKAISVGVSSILMTGIGTGAVTGTPSPIPFSGITDLYMR